MSWTSGDLVCCLNCKWFRVCDEYKPYCIYEDECNFVGIEELVQREQKPLYEQRPRIGYGLCKTCYDCIHSLVVENGKLSCTNGMEQPSWLMKTPMALHARRCFEGYIEEEENYE